MCMDIHILYRTYDNLSVVALQLENLHAIKEMGIGGKQ